MADQDARTNRDPKIVAGATPEELDREIKRLSARRTRRGFIVGGIAAAGGYGLWKWIDESRDIGRQPLPLRRTFQVNSAISRAVFREGVLAPTYAKSRAVNDLRLNGDYGLKQELAPDGWRLQLTGVENPHRYPQFADDVTRFQYSYMVEEELEAAPQDAGIKGPAKAPLQMKASTIAVRPRGSEEAGVSASGLQPGTPGLLLGMSDLWKLPHQEFVSEFKCIEGWSQIVSWGGVRLADLITAYPPAKLANGKLPRYVYMETPDGDYYGGYDMAVAMHPQSLLVYEMSGRPITRWHGAPLRFHTPLKYGYKQIKRVGLIAYTDIKPDDYWTKLGYDWYAGL